MVRIPVPQAVSDLGHPGSAYASFTIEKLEFQGRDTQLTG
jgi:hypothetical protein